MMSCSSQAVASDGLYELKNQKIYYQNHGDINNKNLLLIHGLMGSSNSFDEIVSVLENHYYLTVIDLPGHGKSNLQSEFSIQVRSRSEVGFPRPIKCPPELSYKIAEIDRCCKVLVN